MTLRIVLIILLIVLALVVVMPFIFNIAGVKMFQFGSVSESPVSIGSRGLLRSQDGGENWTAVVSENRRDSFPAQIFDIVFNPQNHDIVFAGAKGDGLWKSLNGGVSWQKVLDKSKVLMLSADVRKVVFSPADSKIIYLAVYQDRKGRVLRSEDNGESFREIYFTSTTGATVSDIFADPFEKNRVLIATGQGGLLESKDGGRTWRVLKWFGQALAKLMVNPHSSQELLAVTSDEVVYKSFDGGEKWADLSIGLRKSGSLQLATIPATNITYPPRQIMPNPFSAFTGSRRYFETIVVDPNRFDTIYVGSKAGLLRSTDGGYSWEPIDVLIPPESLPVTAVAIYPGNSNLMFVGASSQIFQSNDNGLDWKTINLPTKSKIRQLLIHPSKSEIMFAIVGS